MTKQEWLDCKDLNKLLKQVESGRKRQLFSLACCRSIEYLMQDQRSKDCLTKIELFIDGKISEKEFKLARQVGWAVDSVCGIAARAADNAVCAADATARAANYSAADATAYWAVYTVRVGAKDEQAERFKQLEIIKDINNPYLEKVIFSSLAASLAEQVYNGDDSARGILSDYLEDEGYPAEVVSHLKSGFHPKGCWLIDQILGKS